MNCDLNKFDRGKAIFDSIHGTIRLTDFETDIIDTPQFQRLRRINQLGFAFATFPEANHTRFCHSIGALGVIDKICLKINTTEEDRFRLRLAALLHDIGHFPFSHTLEDAYDLISHHSQIKESEKISDMKEGTFQETANIQQKKNFQLHERFSHKIASQILEKHLPNNELKNDRIRSICDSITGECSNPRYFNQLMHSNIDADNMDYLLRDSRKTGIPYGNYDFNYLLESFELLTYNELTEFDKLIEKFKLIKEETKGDYQSIVILHKGLNSLEHFYLARYYWYTQIIFHQSLAITEIMAKHAATKLIQNGIIHSPKYVEKLIDDSENPDYLFFDDNYFMVKLKETMNNPEDKDGTLRIICTALINRIMPKVDKEKRIVIRKNINEPKESSNEKVAPLSRNSVTNKRILNEKYEIEDPEQIKELKGYFNQHLGEMDAVDQKYHRLLFEHSKSDSKEYLWFKRELIKRPPQREDAAGLSDPFTEMNIPTLKLKKNKYLFNVGDPTIKTNRQYRESDDTIYVLLNHFKDSLLNTISDIELHVFRTYTFKEMDLQARKLLALPDRET